MNLLNDMKVASKLFLLLAILLIGFSGIGVTYFTVLKAETDALDASQSMIRFQTEMQQVQVEVGRAVALQRDFVLEGDIGSIDRFDVALSAIRENLGEMSEIAPNDDLKKLIEPVSAALVSFHDEVYKLAETKTALGLDKNQNTGLTGAMRDAVHNLEDELLTLKDRSGLAISEQLSLEKLESSMLSMRRHEKDYIKRESSKYLNRMIEEIAVFLGILEDSKLSDDDKSRVGGLVFTYHDTFHEVVDFTEKLGVDRKNVNEAFSTVQPALEFISVATEEAAFDAFTKADVTRKRLTTIFWIVLVVTAGLMMVFLFAVSRSITEPLGRLQGVVRQVTAGDMDARAHLETEDEIGVLGDAFDTLLDERLSQQAEAERERAERLAEAESENEALNNSVVELLQAVARLSQRDLTVQLPVAEDVTGPVSDALNLLTSETSKVLTEVTQISGAVASASRNVKAQADTVVSLAGEEREQVTQTSDQLAEAAEAMNEISRLAQTCNETAENAIQKTQAALETVTGTVSGINATRDTIRETEKRIKRLGERSQEISGAVNLINNIAERTHILALNASMHAASAGEAGRGFAVVADEVQRLAENARQATEQIAGLVSNIQTETMDTVTTMNTVITQVVEGSRLAEQAGEQMRETQETTAELVDSVRQIAAGSQTQAKVSNELRDRAGEIVASTLKTGHQLEEQGIQTSQLLDYSSRLVQAVRVFKLPGSVDTSEIQVGAFEDMESIAEELATQETS